MSAFERTGFRDQALSERHRLWGAPCAMTDLDFIAIEYDFGRPVAVIEFKKLGMEAEPPDFSNTSLIALKALADGCEIPFVVAHYSADPWQFRVFSGNEFGRGIFSDKQRFLSEEQFVECQYQLRGRAMPNEVKLRLDNLKPFVGIPF